jgi:hypothetical protein
LLIDYAAAGSLPSDGSFTLEVNGVEVYEGPRTWAAEDQYFELVKLEFTNGDFTGRANKKRLLVLKISLAFSAIIMMTWI